MRTIEDLRHRISHLSQLKAGWLDGSGQASVPGTWEWLGEQLEKAHAAGMPIPMLAPWLANLAGKLVAEIEWGDLPHYPSVSIDFQKKVGEYIDLDINRNADVDVDDGHEESLDLSAQEGWDRLLVLVLGNGTIR